MSNILFTHSYFLRFDPKQWKTGLPYPPLGTLYAASLMRENGHMVSLFDTMFEPGPDAILKALETEKPDFFVIYDDGFNYLTKMCLINMREAALRMCKIAKEMGCTVIVSGSDSTDQFEKYLEQGADFVIIGEAEYTLLELIEHIQEGRTAFSSIKGLTFFERGQAVKTAPRNVLKNLDDLPFPAWDLADISLYRESWLRRVGYFSLNMATTRGCPFKCNWCAKPIYGNRYNSRSPENVIEEIKMLKEMYGIDHIWFCDDIFGLKPGWVLSFSKLLRLDNLNIRFKIQSRADLLAEEESVSALAAAGCKNVWIGAESGSQKVLDAMDKGTTIEQIHTATRLMKKYAIDPSFFIQFGYPGESKNDIQLTIKMINDLLPYEIGISVSYPLPGTVFYERVKADLKQKTNWTDSDEMALMFVNTFPASYYKQLHRYVHKNYLKHLAMNSLLNLARNPLKISVRNFKKGLSFFYYTPATFIERIRLNQLERV